MTYRSRWMTLVSLAFLTFARWWGTAEAQSHLASSREGAKIVEVSSILNRQSRAENLLDGDPTTTWATARGKLTNQYVIIRLASGRPVNIGAVAIDNSVAPGHPPQAALRHFELAVSVIGTDERDFTRVESASCRLGAGRQVFTFRPATARYVRLTLGGNYGHQDWIELAEIEVYPAGAPPVQRAGTQVLLMSDSSDSSGALYATLLDSLARLGISVKTFPGSNPSRSLSLEALAGFRVAIVSCERALTESEGRTLLRFVSRGGGLVCGIPSDPSGIVSVLQAFGASARAHPAYEQTVRLIPHWITDEIPAPTLSADAAVVELPQGEPLATLADGRPVAVAGAMGAGRLVLLPVEALYCGGGPEHCELARRAVLWAAAMEDTSIPPLPKRLELSGRAVFLEGSRPVPHLAFDEFRKALATHGLDVRDHAGGPESFDRSAIGDARLLIGFMPKFDTLVSLDIADWVATGGALLALGDAQSKVSDLIAVNRFLREFGIAMALSPAANLSVEVCEHPATLGVRSLSRPGEPLGVWCLQGVPLARMASTPVAVARTFGKGRVIAMDAGFVADPPPSSAERSRTQATCGIHLEQNREFGLRCVAWLLGSE